MDNFQVGKLIRALRTENNMTQRQLAGRLGLPSRLSPNGNAAWAVPTFHCWRGYPKYWASISKEYWQAICSPITGMEEI